MMSRQDGLVQVMDYGMAQQQFGIPDIQINSESMRQAIDAWGTRILAGVLLSTMVFWAWGRVVVCMLTAVAAAVMLTVGIKGSRRFFGWLRETWRVTWALPPLLGVLQAVGAQIDVIVAVVALSAPVAGGAWLTRDGRQD